MSENENIEFDESILLMYINDELSEEERIPVDKWLLSSSANLDHFNKLKKTWELSGQLKSKPVVVNTDDAWKKVLGEIKEETKVVPISQPRNNRRIWWSIAAAMVILVGVYGILQIDTGGSGEMVHTDGGDTIVSKEMVVVDTLQDGSIITLNENSSLSYDQSFGKSERRVEFKGEAFFDIERDEEKPFVIGLEEELHVTVLGTSFNIDAAPNDTVVEVYVKSGKVEFGTAEKTIILVAGEKGIYRKADSSLTKIVDDLEEMKSTYWMNQSLEFDGTALSDVIEILNQVFEERIELNCPKAASLPFVSEHNEEPLEEILKVIAELNNLTLKTKEEDGEIVYSLDCDER